MKIPPKTEAGEWQVDERGRRYRKIGSSIEYEPEINGVPQSVFIRSQKAQREKREAELKEERRKAAERAAQRRNCPLMDGINTDCTREACALFLNGCTLARITDRPPKKATEGLKCPFSRYNSKCRKDCAMFKGNGCIITGITESEE